MQPKLAILLMESFATAGAFLPVIHSPRVSSATVYCLQAQKFVSSAIRMKNIALIWLILTQNIGTATS